MSMAKHTLELIALQVTSDFGKGTKTEILKQGTIMVYTGKDFDYRKRLKNGKHKTC